MYRFLGLSLLVVIALYVLAPSSLANAATNCTDCIFDTDTDTDTDGDDENEAADDFLTCFGESDPTWSATCEAYDFDATGYVGAPDLATWDSNCGAAPILCGDVNATIPPVPALSPTGRILVFLAIAMMGASGATLYSARRRRTG